MTKVEVDRIERNARRYLSNTVGVEREHASCVKDILALTANDQVQRDLIDQVKITNEHLTAVNTRLEEICKEKVTLIEQQANENKTLRDALQAIIKIRFLLGNDPKLNPAYEMGDIAQQALRIS